MVSIRVRNARAAVSGRCRQTRRRCRSFDLGKSVMRRKLRKVLARARREFETWPMLSLKSKARRQETMPAPMPAGIIQFSVNDTMKSAIVQIATKWGIPIEEAARRIMVMALSGWKLKFAGYLTQLSDFCKEPYDTFQATCLTLRNWLVQHEKGMEEALSDPDVQARLEMILDALKEKRRAGAKADLNEILAEDDLDDLP